MAIVRNNYILRFDYIGVDLREWITKPMTRDEFKWNFENDYRAEQFPILIEGGRMEFTGDDNVEWDILPFTEDMYRNPNLQVSWGIYDRK